MRTKTIYLIRHGETDYNLKGIVQGSGIDAPLNTTGQKQASAFYNYYQDIPFQKVYTSALIRTHQTVKGFLDAGLPHHILPGLNEISWGDMEGITPNVGRDEYYLDLTTRWHSGETDLAVKGGESPEDVAERQKVSLKHIIEQKEEDLILIAMHGRAMRILLAHISKLPLAKMNTFGHKNVCLYKLSYSYETGQFSILDQNNVDHLANMAI